MIFQVLNNVLVINKEYFGIIIAILQIYLLDLYIQDQIIVIKLIKINILV